MISRRKGLRPRSDRRIHEQKKYLFLREQFLFDHPRCEARVLPAACQGTSADVHHTEGRGKNFLKVETWLAVCRNCHDWIHAHGHVAEALGLKKRTL